jgi:hypothetical protein
MASALLMPEVDRKQNRGVVVAVSVECLRSRK